MSNDQSNPQHDEIIRLIEQRRNDPAFAKRLQESIERDKKLLNRLAGVDGADQFVERFNWFLAAFHVLRAMPGSAEYRANRYDTDDMMVLHLWLPTGESFDIQLPLLGAEQKEQE